MPEGETLGVSGGSLRDEILASRHLRQEEIVLDSENDKLDLKRIYSIPIQGVEIELSIPEILDSKYSDIVEYK